MGKLGLNVQVAQAGLVDATTPILAIVSADVDAMLAEGLAAFAGKNVVLWRPANRDPRLCLRPAGQGGLPLHARMQLGNEFDDDCLGPTGWGHAFEAYARTVRPDLELWYGGPPVDDPSHGDSELLARCDGFVAHIGVNADGSYFPSRDQLPAGMRTMLGEVEVDPQHLEALAQMVPAAIRALADFSADYAFLWGASADVANAVMNFGGIDFRGQVAAYNTNQGDTDMTDDQAKQLLDQNALIADALYDLTKVIVNEPAITKGGVVDAMLQDAKTKVNALNPERFTFS